MTQAERYEKETGNPAHTIITDGVHVVGILVPASSYLKWLETGKEKAEQERDEALAAAIDFAEHLRMWKFTPDRAGQFLDKHKESAE